MRGELFSIDRGRGDDDAQVGTPALQLLQVTEQEIDIQAALVGLVDDDRIVGIEVAVVAGLGQQDAVGHELDDAVPVEFFAEADLVTDHAADLGIQFLRHPFGHRLGRDPARLCTTDQATRAATGLHAHLRNLGGFTRTGFTGDHHDLVLPDRGDDVIAAVNDRQCRIIVRFGQIQLTLLTALRRGGAALDQGFEDGIDGFSRFQTAPCRLDPLPAPGGIGLHDAIEQSCNLVE